MAVWPFLAGMPRDAYLPKEHHDGEIKLELDELEVASFVTKDSADADGGTVYAHSTPDGCGPTVVRITCLCDLDHG
jgi:hypothetical protein